MERFWSDKHESLMNRLTGTDSPKKKIYIAFEGDVTEPDYFYQFIEFNKDSSKYQVEMCPLLRYVGDNSSHPEHVRDGLIEYFRAFVKGDLFDEIKDELWIVIDIDKHFINSSQTEEETYKSYLNTLEIDGIKINAAVSNPCFELWLILHHTECKLLNLTEINNNKIKFVKDRNNIRIKTTYIKDLWYQTKKSYGALNLMSKLDFAIQNAQSHMLQQNILEMTHKPGTLVYKIFESIN